MVFNSKEFPLLGSRVKSSSANQFHRFIGIPGITPIIQSVVKRRLYFLLCHTKKKKRHSFWKIIYLVEKWRHFCSYYL